MPFVWIWQVIWAHIFETVHVDVFIWINHP